MIEINGKIYRNLQEQVEKNKEDIKKLKEAGDIGYTAGDGINITEDVISVDSTIETKANATSRFVSKANLTDFSINEIIVANSKIDNDNVDLKAVYSQDVKSEVSLDPTSTIIRTMSGTDVSTIGISATEMDITTGALKYNGNEVINIDADKNLNETVIRVDSVTSRDGEEADNKGSIDLNSGLRTGSVYISASGEESGASIYVKGTKASGSEGEIELTGKTKINTSNRIEVTDGYNTEQVAYLSDLQSLIDRITALENNNN